MVWEALQRRTRQQKVKTGGVSDVYASATGDRRRATGYGRPWMERLLYLNFYVGLLNLGIGHLVHFTYYSCTSII